MSLLDMALEGALEAARDIRARQKEARRTMRTGVKQAADIVRDGGRAATEFKDRSGKLRKAIRSKKEKERGGFLSYKVGPDPKKAPHGYVVEKGHRLVTSKKNGRREIGIVKGRDYMWHVVQAKKQQVLKTVEAAIAASMR